MNEIYLNVYCIKILFLSDKRELYLPYKISQLMLCREIISVYSKNRTETTNTSTSCEQSREFSNLKISDRSKAVMLAISH
jgi:hypothetical protein